MTEEQLNEIVKNAVNNHVSMIMEYAIPRIEFIRNVSNMVQQIIENWCLVHYCTLFGDRTEKEHWRNELTAHMLNVSRKTIKKNDSYETRLKAVSEGFDWNDLPSDASKVYSIVCHKFIVEGIIDKTSFRNIDQNLMKCAEDCNNEINNIISIIAEKNELNIQEYANNL